MNNILLVQHCQSEHHINQMTGGWTDTPLSEMGRQQAGRVAVRLSRMVSAGSISSLGQNGFGQQTLNLFNDTAHLQG